MAIKNKDGSIFKLNGPNPAMRQQDLWDDGSQFVLHNFKYDEVILHNFDNFQENKPEPEPAPKPKKKKHQPLDEIVPQEIIVPVKETVVPQEDKVRKKKQVANISLIYCLPAITTHKQDPLYQDSRVTVTYGVQFTLEVIVTSSTDLTFQVWATKELTKNSILYYPSTRRWWRVEACSDKNEGFTVDCSPSALQPSFRLLP